MSRTIRACLSVAVVVALSLEAIAQTDCTSSIGPDVIVGDITGPSNYASNSGVEALALGTTACNIGDVWLNWYGGSYQHPVVGGALFRYRLVDGASRFEQIGQSWLKHGYTAVSLNVCCTGCQATDGTHLGVHCADAYHSSRNGTQADLGPRWQVNAHTGYFAYPTANPGWSGSTARRLEVKVADLSPSDRYFAEALYVSPDDASAGNQDNNASHREVVASGSGAAWEFALVGQTRREQPAVRAWKALDPAVRQVDLTVPDEGARMILTSRATDLGGGRFHYEYLLYNQNSDVSANSFSVPVAASLTVTDVGFHDVDYRNGDGPGDVNFDGTDWPSTTSGGTLSWATQSFAQNASANAIRWSTAYSFRFDCNAPPQSGMVTIGLYKTAGTMTAIADVPSSGLPPTNPFCFGDGIDPQVTALCPCANFGSPGRGCDNSATTGGALLTASGTTAPDVMILTSSSELPTALSIFLQGDTSNPSGVVFGDGVRCVAGTLSRLYVENAVGGTVSAPSGGDPSITARSASLGDPIAPGSTRYYQVHYRDPDLAFCAHPTGSSFNVSSGLSILW